MRERPAGSETLNKGNDGNERVSDAGTVSVLAGGGEQNTPPDKFVYFC